MNELRKNFENHIATLKQYDEVSILEWKAPNTCNYAVKYLMSDNILAISGDLGEAVFNLTWNATNLKSYKGLSIGYFFEKLRAYCGQKYEFSKTMAINELKEQIEIIKDYHGEDEIPQNDERAIELLNNMIETIKDEVVSSEDWKYYLIAYGYYDDYSDVDTDCNEWIFDIGQTIPSRIKLYLTGLQMAYEQLDKENE